MKPGVVVHAYNPAGGRLVSGKLVWICWLQKERREQVAAGMPWLPISSLSLQNICLEEEAALLAVFHELHGH